MATENNTKPRLLREVVSDDETPDRLLDSRPRGEEQTEEDEKEKSPKVLTS